MAGPNFSHGSGKKAQTKRTHNSTGKATEKSTIARVRGLNCGAREREREKSMPGQRIGEDERDAGSQQAK